MQTRLYSDSLFAPIVMLYRYSRLRVKPQIATAQWSRPVVSRCAVTHVFANRYARIVACLFLK